MKKLLIAILILCSFGGYAQSNLTNNAIFNLKDSRSSSIYKFHYLNNTDSIFSIDSVGIKAIRPVRLKGRTTAQRPAFAVEGMMGYNTDSLKLEYYDGAAWQSLGISTATTYTAGSGLTLTAGQFKLGSTLSENLTLNTGGTYTFSLTDGTTPMIYSDANERVSIKGTTNAGYDFYINGQFGAASGTGALYFNGATSLIYTAGTADMVIRLTGRSKEFRHNITTSSYIFRPNTDNTLPYYITNVAAENIFGVDFANKLTLLYAVPTATSNDTKLLVKGSSDSAIRQMDFPITSTTYTVTLTNTTNIASSSTNTTYYQRLGDVVHVWGEFTATASATGICEMGFSIPVSSAFANTYDGNGTGSSDAYSVRIYADATNDRMVFRWTAPNTSATTHSFHFTYKYIAP